MGEEEEELRGKRTRRRRRKRRSRRSALMRVPLRWCPLESAGEKLPEECTQCTTALPQGLGVYSMVYR